MFVIPRIDRLTTGISRKLAFLFLAICFVSSETALSNTHLGVGPEAMVVLEMATGVDGGCGKMKVDFVRVFPDGRSNPSPFRVPPGRALLVTDVDWHYFNGPPSLVVILSVYVENLSNASQRNRVFESTVRLGADGVGGASERMTTGFLVAGGSRMCLDVVNGSIGNPMRLSKVLIRGYLVNLR